MKKNRLTSRLFLMLGFIFALQYTSAQQLNYTDLVNRLTDLKALAVLPAPGEKSAMWSSYDRKSKVSPSGEFIAWGANNDGLSPQYIRKEGENMVLAEMQGPGAIVRMWSASPAKGHVKIYIDGKETPVVDLPFIDYFKNTSIPAFRFPELVYETNARGHNNYVPIPYQKSCKIVAEPGWGQYYQFNYITFPEGTTLEAFSPDLNEKNDSALAKVNNFFHDHLGELPYAVKEGEKKSIALKIAPGGSDTVTLQGSQAIYSFKIKMKWNDQKRMDEALRKLILQIYWDGSNEAAVWSPVGDFFASAPGYNAYKTVPMSMYGGAMHSYWYMPFERSAEIILTNHFDSPLELELSLGLEALSGDLSRYGRFHAKWHRNLPPLADTSRWPDWTVLETAGTGRFLGMSLLVWNPKGGSCKQYGGEGHWWWGEGDEKFFVDGETFPSTFGTGTEDYFGYAWCMPDYFSRPFHSQNHTAGNMGYQSMNRWQISDNVPFQQSFKGYLEKYFPDQWPTQYAVTAYWYLDKNGKDPIGATPVAALYGYEIPYDVYREPGVIEGEHLQLGRNTGGYATTDSYANEKLFKEVSGHKVLLWEGDPKKERKLQVTFNIDKPGRYKVTSQLIKSPAGGNFKLSLNGNDDITIDVKSATEPGRVAEVELGIFNLKGGKQTLEITAMPTTGSGSKLMLDYIALKPVN